MNSLPNISFSQNWNGAKLLCDMFPSFRLPNHKYEVGNRYNLMLKDVCLGRVELVKIYRVRFNDITEGMAFTDVGRPLAYLKQVLKRMYQKRQIDWDNQTLYWLWLRHLDHENEKNNLIQQRSDKLGVQSALFTASPTGAYRSSQTS